MNEYRLWHWFLNVVILTDGEILAGERKIVIIQLQAAENLQTYITESHAQYVAYENLESYLHFLSKVLKISIYQAL